MPSDSLSFNQRNEYLVRVKDPENGYLEVLFRNRLLYKYMLINNEINGTGYCYYPFLGRVAIQGQFKEGRLNGVVCVLAKDGGIIECMKYKKGIYKKHIYHWLDSSSRSIREKRKNRSSNPLKGDEVIVR